MKLQLYPLILLLAVTSITAAETMLTLARRHGNR